PRPTTRPPVRATRQGPMATRSPSNNWVLAPLTTRRARRGLTSPAGLFHGRIQNAMVGGTAASPGRGRPVAFKPLRARVPLVRLRGHGQDHPRPGLRREQRWERVLRRVHWEGGLRPAAEGLPGCHYDPLPNLQAEGPLEGAIAGARRRAPRAPEHPAERGLHGFRNRSRREGLEAEGRY